MPAGSISATSIFHSWKVIKLENSVNKISSNCWDLGLINWEHSDKAETSLLPDAVRTLLLELTAYYIAGREGSNRWYRKN